MNRVHVYVKIRMRMILYLSAAVFLCCAGSATAQTSRIESEFGPLKDGVYQGSYKKGPAKADMEIVIKDGKIESAVPIKDWYYARKKVAVTIGLRIVEKQNTEVDAVSEVTVTSKAIMYAVEDALRKAKQTDGDVQKEGDAAGERSED